MERGCKNFSQYNPLRLGNCNDLTSFSLKVISETFLFTVTVEELLMYRLIFFSRKLIKTFTSDCPKPYVVPQGTWGANRAARLELACAYRGLEVLGLHEGVCNHLTAMAPAAKGNEEVMLVFPYGLHWSEVSASNLLGVDKSGSVLEGDVSQTPELAAACIHLGIRRVRPDAKVIMHTHQPYATALGCLKDSELKMVHQNSTRFYKRIAYDTNYSGLADAIAEGERLGEEIGDADILMMGNHGVVVVAPTIAMAFDHVYYLERAAEVQILAESTGRELTLISDAQSKQSCDTFWQDMQKYADAHFYSMFRRLRKSQPDFEL
ncbi:unnamed protein product, partial [Meganyctiphanes norvegica]